MSFLNIFAFNQGDETYSSPEDARMISGRYRVLPHRKSLLFWTSPSREHSTNISPIWFESGTYEGSLNENSTLLEGLVIAPQKKLVKRVLYGFWRRLFILNILPSAIVLIWCAIPFPLSRSYIDNPLSPLVKDRINFWFFLFIYYGFYNAIGLLWITKLFNLFSLNWFLFLFIKIFPSTNKNRWPASLGGAISYTFFWTFSVFLGSLIYLFSEKAEYTLTWILLTFCTMAGPIVVAFAVLRASDRHMNHHSLSHTQETFFNRTFDSHFPSSYIRFLWFCLILVIGLAAFAAGEAYARLYLKTLPHSSTDALLYVYSWVTTVYVLDIITSWILSYKIKSESLAWVFKLYYAMTLQIYVRNLYARLHSPQQFAVIQGASSFTVIIIVPALMTKWSYKGYLFFTKSQVDYEYYKKNSGRSFYIKTLAQNITMISFLGWICILHFGPNKSVYPYFTFSSNESSNDDVYSFRLTFFATLVVWASELISSFITRLIMKLSFKFEVTKEALKDMMEFPDILPAALAVCIHVLQNMLFSIIHLGFT
ncbi:uncharacterized protein T551_01297 [Pneumocystis jirovecii RU7]|uniref:Uncharacterized protein n=1 Tax=Pneumocystis jirovecii (strain RU7) TaxID=1408657 RepID=A0A0W4ZS70_PNEJ7|nr:uncharacterized protein T551_01297 [Pneumocystis jirovecii RU7]KTW31224.1 hypothetical protein T551_01297 [Pneumocystis jirovecii RU7]